VKKILNWIPALLLMLIIFYLSSQPGYVVDSTIANTENVQKIGHLILFMLLCLSYFKATKNIGLSIFLTFLYACFDEFHQFFVLDRSPSFGDIFTDMIGASISGVFLWKLLPILPTKLKNLLTK
jgi:VanZ family protein